MKVQNIVCILSLLLFPAVSHSSQIVSALYGFFLGSRDVRQGYKERVQQALRDLGVKNPKKVPIKQMNSLGSVLAGVDLSSFTAYGIWLDERYLDQCSPEEREFQLYHEASHYVWRHHQRNLLWLAGSCVVDTVGFLALKKSLSASSALVRWSALIGTSGLALAGTGIAARHLVKRQEKQADIMAACMLVEVGKKHVVESYIRQLAKSVQESAGTEKNTMWWFSDAERIAYLKDALRC